MLREAAAQLVGELRHLDLRDAERGGHRLASQVVGRAAEAAGHEQVVDPRALAVDEVGDGLDLVRDAGGEHDLHAEPLEPLREPGGIGVDDVAGDDLVADREQSCAHPV